MNLNQLTSKFLGLLIVSCSAQALASGSAAPKPAPAPAPIPEPAPEARPYSPNCYGKQVCNYGAFVVADTEAPGYMAELLWDPSYSLDRVTLSRGGNQMALDLRLKDRDTHNVFLVANGADIIFRYRAKLLSCDGIEVNPKFGEVTSEKLIEQLEGLDSSDFLSCSFESATPASSEEIKDYLNPNMNGYKMAKVTEVASLKVSRDGRWAFRFSPGLQQGVNKDIGSYFTDRYFQIERTVTVQEPRSTQADSTALDNAVNEFVALLREHGDNLLLSSRPNMSAAERNVAIRASVDRLQTKLVAALDKVRAEIKLAPTSKAIGTLWAIQRAYGLVAEIERRVVAMQDDTNRLKLDLDVTHLNFF